MSMHNPIVINDDSEASDSESSNSECTLSGEQGYWYETVRPSTAGILGRRVTNAAIISPLRVVDACRLSNGQTVSVGDCVELLECALADDASPPADFLLIRKIIYNTSSRCHDLRGHRLMRNYKLCGSLELQQSEVCVLLEVQSDDRRSPKIQGLVEYPMRAAVNKRRVIFTNGTMGGAEERLVCRYCVTQEYQNATARRQQKPSGAVYQRISERDSETGFAASDEALFMDWRQTQREYDGTERLNKLYTFGDAFAGCGGVSLGATHAGLKLLWAFDMAVDAVDTLGRMLDHKFVYHATADQFYSILASAPDEFCRKNQVTIVHFSPPCQYFSPANTRSGQATNDDANSAAIFCIGPIMMKVRPRICTMEQTFGLKTHHSDWMPGVINIFLSLGFSLRWKVLNLADYGVSQERKRLIVIASCPGSDLPDFPSPTHHKPGRGLFPSYTTIGECIAYLDEQIHAHHNPSAMRPLNKIPYSPNVQLKSCITTGGSDNYHPSGKRNFTVRELASLMSFPSDFDFPEGQSQGSMRRQIGNAVPPVFATALLETIKQALVREDEEKGYTR